MPRPSEQLAMANKKKDKEPRSYHVSIIFFHLFGLYGNSNALIVFFLTVGFKHGGPFLLNIIGAKAI